MTLVMSTHNLGQAKRLATRVIYMDERPHRRRPADGRISSHPSDSVAPVSFSDGDLPGPLDDRCAPCALRRGGERQVEEQVLRLQLQRLLCAHRQAEIDRLAGDVGAHLARIGEVEAEQADQALQAFGVARPRRDRAR